VATGVAALIDGFGLVGLESIISRFQHIIHVPHNTNTQTNTTHPQDDDSASTTTQIRLLCDVATRIAIAISQKLLDVQSTEGLRERGLLTSPPGTIVLPQLYRAAAEPPAKGALWLCCVCWDGLGCDMLCCVSWAVWAAELPFGSDPKREDSPLGSFLTALNLLHNKQPANPPRHLLPAPWLPSGCRPRGV